MPTSHPMIPDDWWPILQVILKADQAWQTPASLARRLSRDVETLTDSLAEMDRAGWLTVWERPDGVMVTLSCWGAAQLEARLTPSGGPGGWRWVDCQLPRYRGAPPNSGPRAAGRRRPWRPALPARASAR